MGWSKSEIVCMVLISPILVPICLVYWVIVTSKSLAEAISTYLFYSARTDLVHFVTTSWIRIGPRKGARNDIFQEQNAKVFAPLFPGETRLLKLYPRQPWPDTGIHCEVVMVPRREIQYEVVSYYSQDRDLCRTIKVDGHHVMVTNHLYLALKHLRTNEPRNLWIEDLSTDTTDNERRGDQQHIQAVFRDAFQGIVWLGSAPRKLKRLLPLFDESSSVAFEDDLGSTAHIFTDLLKRPWWNRLWSVQELALPPKVIVQCGKHRIPWTNFAQTIGLSYIDSNHSKEASRARSMAWTRFKYQSAVDHEYGLLSLVWEFRDSQVDDDRDKLYALLGLLPEEEQSIKFDYFKHINQVYMDFVQAWINHYGSLLILNLTQRQQRKQHSWYPIWSEPFEDHPQFFCGSAFSSHSFHFWEGKFSADGGRRAPNCTYSKAEPLLRLQGFTHDTVAVVAPSAYEPHLGGAHADLEKCRKAWWEFTQTWSSEDKEGLSQEFWLAITAGLVDSDGGTVNYETVQRATCEQRRLFITQNGEIGVGPSAVAPGDKVCVVFGSPVPFVLSECKTCDLVDKSKSTVGSQGSSPPLLQTWRYVGDAYVHGIMHYTGDVDDDVKAERLFVEDFLLC